MNKQKFNENKPPIMRKSNNLTLNRNDVNPNILSIKQPKYSTVELKSFKMEYDSNDSDSDANDLNNNTVSACNSSYKQQDNVMHSSTLRLNIRTASKSTRSKERNTSVSSLMFQKDPNYFNLLKFDPFDRTISRLSGK
jgi:hypothetical protein